MNKKGNIGAFILFFIGVIVAFALLPTIANGSVGLSEPTTIADDSIDVSTTFNGTDVDNTVSIDTSNVYEDGSWAIQNCPFSGVALGNASTSLTGSGTDYQFDVTNGTFVLNNSAATLEFLTTNDNTTLVDYVFCPEGYVTSGGGRAIAKLITLFAALGLLGFVIYYSLGKLKEFN